MTQNLRSIKIKINPKKSNTLEITRHTTKKDFDTVKKKAVLKFPLRETCQPCVLEAKKRLQR
jgi:hypothetical protein